MSKNLRLNFWQRSKIAAAFLFGGKYDSAGHKGGAFRNWRPHSDAPNDDLIYELPHLRARSSDLLRNNPLAIGALKTKTTNIVGTGLQLSAQIDKEALNMSADDAEAYQKRAEREFNNFALSEFCSIDGRCNFLQQQKIAFRSQLERGDCVALLPRKKRDLWPYHFAVQLIEADRVCNPDNKRNTDLLIDGFKHNEDGELISVWIADKHPGLYGSVKNNWTEYPIYGEGGRRNVLVLSSYGRVGQVRGVPDLTPVMELFKQMGNYTQSEVEAAVTTSFLAIFTKTPLRAGIDPTSDSGGEKKERDEPYEMGPATVLDLLPGEDVEVPDMTRPNNNFDPFILSVLRQVGAALEIPFEVLIKHFSSSYSASRAALEDAKRYFFDQRAMLAAQLCQPVYEEIITDAVIDGRIVAPGFLQDYGIRRAFLGNYIDQWIGPGFAPIDPKRHAEALAVYEKYGYYTAAQITRELTGRNWHNNILERGREEEKRRKLGLIPEQSQTTATEDAFVDE